jgi:uncharacterized pyridoxamine 5'-phosphate oxidase family protein
MVKLYFRNVKTNKRYEVVSLDKEKNEVTLRGETATFVEPYDKQRFQQLGYVLERIEEDEMAE